MEKLLGDINMKAQLISQDLSRASTINSTHVFSFSQYSRLHSRTRFGWVKWLELYRRDELIFRLSFNIIREISGYRKAVELSKYLKIMSSHVSDIKGRGSNPRALAAAISYYVITIFGNEKFSLNTFFKWTSKASLYRALKNIVKLLGHSDIFYKLLLSNIEHSIPRIYNDKLYFPHRSLVIYRDPLSLYVLSERVIKGYIRYNKSILIQGFIIPIDYVMRYKIMNSVELKFRFRISELIQLLKEKTGIVFTARDVAGILCTDPQYAGRLLSLLVKEGFLEIVEEKPIRKYRIKDN